MHKDGLEAGIERISIECHKYLANCFCFALPHSVIGSKFSHHFFNQSEVKPKSVVACACTFSHAMCGLCVITLSFYWFTRLPLFFLNGENNTFFFVWFYDIGLKRAVYQRDINCLHLCFTQCIRKNQRSTNDHGSIHLCI